MSGSVMRKAVLPSRKLRVLYIQPGTLIFAGIERVVDTICTELAQECGTEFDVDVLYTSVHHSFPPGPRKYNAIHRVTNSRIALLRVYREVIGRRRYDLVIVPQVEPTVRCWIACLGRGQRFAMHLHGNPAMERTNVRSRIAYFLMRCLILERLGGIFGTSPRQLGAFKAMYPTDVSSFWVPNPVRQFSNVDAAPRPGERPVTFVNVGRFDHQKGQDTLIRAFAQVLKDRPGVLLRLVGFGADEPSLRGMIAELGIGAAVRIEHYPSSPEVPLGSSDVYVSASRWEGWSLAICEAMRFGLPVISTDCDYGPSDILTDQRFGTLVPNGNEAALADAMRYYHDNLEAEKAHAGVRREAMDVYSAGRVVHAHAAALRSAVSQ